MLTQEEVSALPDGTEVMVHWSGGNGPLKYILRIIGGWPFVDVIGSTMRYQLECIGKGEYHTKVWLV